LTFPTWSESTDFHPLGLAFDSPSSKLYVINHSRHSGSVIEIFHVDLQKHSATHLQTFKHPLLHAPNSLELLGDGRLYVTNDHYIRSATSRLLAKLEGLAGVPGGSVVYVDTNLPPGPENGKVVARLPFANGIVRYNASTVVVASSSKPGLYFYTIAPNGIDLVYKSYIRTPAGPDNLSLDSAGKIMVAGHPFAPPLIKVAEGRPKCNEHGTEEQKKACGCWAPSWVGEWSEEGGLKTLLMESGGEVCSSSTAVRDVERGVGMVSMLYGKGIVVFKE
jgi:arylesterase/paraoxonase